MSTFNLKDILSPEMQSKLEQALGAELKEISSPPEVKKPVKAFKPKPKSASLPKTEPQKPPAQMSKDYKARLDKIKVVQQWLQETWPLLFNLQQPKPLKRQIEQEIMAHAADKFSKIQIRRAIQAYTNRMPYLTAVLNGEGRYDLNGDKVGEVSESEKEYSKKILDMKNQRYAEQQEKKKQWKLSQKSGGKAVDKMVKKDSSQQED